MTTTNLSDRIYFYDFSNAASEVTEPALPYLIFELQHPYVDVTKKILNFCVQEFRDMVGKQISINEILPASDSSLSISISLTDELDSYGNKISDILQESTRFKAWVKKYSISSVQSHGLPEEYRMTFPISDIYTPPEEAKPSDLG